MWCCSPRLVPRGHHNSEMSCAAWRPLEAQGVGGTVAAFPTSWCLVVVVATLGCSVWHQPVPLSSWGSWGHPAVTSAALSLLFHLRPHSNSWGEGVTRSSWRTRCAPPPPGDQKQSHSQDTQQRPRALKARSDLGLVRGGLPVRPLPALKTLNISSSPAALPTQGVAGYAAVRCSRTSHTWWQARQGPGALGSARCPVWWPPSSQALSHRAQTGPA